MTDPRFGKSSASKLGIITKCPGYFQLLDSIKSSGHAPPEDSPDISFGTEVHAAWAGNISELSLSERQQLVKQKADRIKANLIHDIFGEDPNVSLKPIAMFVETRFRLFNKSRQVVHSAQIDWAGHLDGKWLVLDLKSLYGDQEPVDQNWQLLSQAVCISDDDEVRNNNGEAPVNEIICGIVQPLINLKPELVKYDAHSLAHAKVMILRKLDEAATPEAPRIPGTHCRYCPCSPHCPESAADLMAIDKRYNLGVDSLTPQMVANILPHLPSLKKRIKDFEGRAKTLADEGLLPGYEIKTVDGNRYIQSQESVQAVRDALANYLSKEDILPLLSLPFGELRQKFIDAYVAKERCDKVAAGKQFDELLKPICQKEQSKRLLTKVKP